MRIVLSGGQNESRDYRAPWIGRTTKRKRPASFAAAGRVWRASL